MSDKVMNRCDFHCLFRGDPVQLAVGEIGVDGDNQGGDGIGPFGWHRRVGNSGRFLLEFSVHHLLLLGR